MFDAVFDTGVLAIGLFAAAAILLVWGFVAALADVRDPVRSRLRDLGVDDEAGKGARSRWIAVLGSLASVLVPNAGAERGRIERQLYRAGLRSDGAAATFFACKAGVALGMPVAWLMAARAIPAMSSYTVWLLAGVALFIGLVAPNRWLQRRVERRQRALRNGFPDALDLLVICVEAGLGLAAAIERVGDELRFSHPELAEELMLVNVEMRAGVEREAALRNLAQRTGLDDIRGLVGLLVQTVRFGTSVADTLRVFSEEFRDKRTQRAEEQAAKLGTKLIIPLILCEFPAFFVVAIGPAVLRLIDAFAQT